MSSRSYSGRVASPGILLGSAVIIADIAVNWTVFTQIGGLSLFGVISQSLFAVLILVTARPLWVWFLRR